MRESLFPVLPGWRRIKHVRLAAHKLRRRRFASPGAAAPLGNFCRETGTEVPPMALRCGAKPLIRRNEAPGTLIASVQRGDRARVVTAARRVEDRVGDQSWVSSMH